MASVSTGAVDDLIDEVLHQLPVDVLRVDALPVDELALNDDFGDVSDAGSLDSVISEVDFDDDAALVISLVSQAVALEQEDADAAYVNDPLEAEQALRAPVEVGWDLAVRINDDRETDTEMRAISEEQDRIVDAIRQTQQVGVQMSHAAYNVHSALHQHERDDEPGDDVVMAMSNLGREMKEFTHAEFCCIPILMDRIFQGFEFAVNVDYMRVSEMFSPEERTQKMYEYRDELDNLLNVFFDIFVVVDADGRDDRNSEEYLNIHFFGQQIFTRTLHALVHDFRSYNALWNIHSKVQAMVVKNEYNQNIIEHINLSFNLQGVCVFTVLVRKSGAVSYMDMGLYPNHYVLDVIPEIMIGEVLHQRRQNLYQFLAQIATTVLYALQQSPRKPKSIKELRFIFNDDPAAPLFPDVSEDDVIRGDSLSFRMESAKPGFRNARMLTSLAYFFIFVANLNLDAYHRHTVQTFKYQYRKNDKLIFYWRLA